MKTASSRSFQPLDFDALSSMAATDLSAFEALRSALIERVIHTPGSNAEQLAALQRRLNEGGDAATPCYLRCLRLSEWLDDPYRRLEHKLSEARAQR